MTDRIFVYPGAIPQDTDILNTARNGMIALGYLAQAVLGTTTVVDGLVCTPTAPASLTVNISQGSIFSLETIDATAYGSLPADTDPLVKVGINPFGITALTLTAPATTGFSINYLIEVDFAETDVGPTVFPYYNAAQPTQPFSGPNNTGAAQNSVRQQRVAIQLKPGIAAASGSQVTPSVDPGWTGLYIITVANGQTTITAGQIIVYPGAPFIYTKLPQVPTTHGQQVFASTAGFVVPNGVTSLSVEIWGGGGGGGGSSGAASAGSGGGGGGYARRVITGLLAGQGITVTIGAGGAGGTGAPTNGSPGGSSSFGAFCSATGGTGGGSATGAIQVSSSGAGGVGSGGAMNLTGNPGNFAFPLPASAIAASQGGAAAWGFPQATDIQYSTTTVTGASGNVGCGGGGGMFGGPGGPGGGGWCIVTW